MDAVEVRRGPDSVRQEVPDNRGCRHSLVRNTQDICNTFHAPSPSSPQSPQSTTRNAEILVGPIPYSSTIVSFEGDDIPVIDSMGEVGKRLSDIRVLHPAITEYRPPAKDSS